MDERPFVELAIFLTTALTALMVAVTVAVKVLRSLRRSWYKSHYRKIEPALEDFLLTGDPQPELERLRPRQRDRFLSALVLERVALLRGSGRERLTRLAEDSGLVDRCLGATRSRRRWTRAWAAENLGHFAGEEAVGPLSDLLADGNETVRAVAARALTRIGTPEAAEALIRTLDDPSELTRLRAAENLERLGDLAVRPLSGLLLTLTDRGATIAARVLGNLKAREARPALGSTLLHARDQNVRAQVTLALGKMGDPDDVPLILKSARDPSWPVRAQAANALGMIGEVSALPALMELAADEAWWVRLNACKALANMGPSGEKALVEILHGDDRYGRERAAATLESRGVTRRMVRRLAQVGPKGERARSVIRAVAEAGATRHLSSLAEGMPEGEERRFLRNLLAEGTDEP